MEKARRPSLGSTDWGELVRTVALPFGIALILFGIVAIAAPGITTLATVFLLGGMLLAGGVVRFVHAIEERHEEGFAWALLAAVLYAVVGFLFIAFPGVGMVTLTLTLGTFFVASGVIKALRALQLRGMPRRGWVLFDGLVTLVLGIILWIGFPRTALWAIGLLVGIDLISGGAMLIGAWLTARRFERARPAAP